jgi:hypothetical protein
VNELDTQLFWLRNFLYGGPLVLAIMLIRSASQSGARRTVKLVLRAAAMLLVLLEACWWIVFRTLSGAANW